MKDLERKSVKESAEVELEETASAMEAALPLLVPPVRVAEMLEVDRRRIYELIEQGELPVVRFGRRGLRICRRGLINWIRRGGTQRPSRDEPGMSIGEWNLDDG